MEYQLEKHEVVAFVADTGDQRLQVTEGLIWLTRSGDSRDYILKPHSRFVVNQSDSVILEAVNPASFSLVPLEPPAHARIILHYSSAIPRLFRSKRGTPMTS